MTVIFRVISSSSSGDQESLWVGDTKHSIMKPSKELQTSYL